MENVIDNYEEGGKFRGKLEMVEVLVDDFVKKVSSTFHFSNCALDRRSSMTCLYRSVRMQCKVCLDLYMELTTSPFPREFYCVWFGVNLYIT